MARCSSIFPLVLLLQCVLINVHAQTKTSSCLYIGEKEKYVLSEKVKLEGGQTQIFNSLFIWDKDKVIRIVFLYDRKLPMLPESVVNGLKSFESFLPTFREVTWHDHAKKGIVSNIFSYDETFTDKGKNDIGGYDYADKLKTLINARNKKHNPLADKFGTMTCQDCDPEVMIYNEKRKGKEINNLPILINLTNGDSSYIISPINIDVYRIDNSEKNENISLKKFTGYKVYSTVSFLKQSKNHATGEDIEESYKWQGRFIEENTLQYLYKTNLFIDTVLLISELTELPLSDKKTHSNNTQYIEPQPIQKKILSKKDSIRLIEYTNNRRKDSLKWRKEIKQQFLNGINFDYQYCAECYDNEMPKRERVRNHCPLKITEYENWSYAFSDKYRHYFKVEQPLKDYEAAPIEYSSEQIRLNRWLLMSPGVGYWMSDVRINNDRYPVDSNKLFLNGKKISE